MHKSPPNESQSLFHSKRRLPGSSESGSRRLETIDRAEAEETEKDVLTGKVLIVQADRLGSGSMRSSIQGVYSDVEVVIARSGSVAISLIENSSFEFVVLSFGSADLIWLDHLPTILKALGSTPVLVVSGRHAPRTFRTLQKIRSVSIFDPVTEGPMDLQLAMRSIINGRRYMSPSVREVMQDPREVKPELLLSLTEEKILSVIGDGCDDDEASLRLSLTPATVATHRKNIMKKLGLHHRGELVRFALKHGYVTRTLDGSLRPGIIVALSQMLAVDGFA